MNSQKMSPLSQLINELVMQLQHVLDQATAQQHAWWLIEALTQKSRSQLIKEQSVTLSQQQQKQLAQWVDDLVHKQKPIAYIIGSLPFCGLELLIEPPILIPRPETEEWVNNLIHKLKKSDIDKLKILDVGTGSGCIALSIAKAFPNYSITATDINKKALDLAKKNAEKNKITNVSFVVSDLFEQLGDQHFDIIISNPPYIGRHELSAMQPSVIAWEDPAALFADEHGDAILKKIICAARAHLTSNPLLQAHTLPQLILEIGYKQATRITSFMIANGYVSVTITKDSFGNDRVISGSLPDAAVPAHT